MFFGTSISHTQNVFLMGPMLILHYKLHKRIKSDTTNMSDSKSGEPATMVTI